MTFFKDLSRKITDTVQDASKKTVELIEVSRLNSTIADEKSAIIDLQKKIGETVYAMYAAGETLPESLMADVNSIAGRMQAIENLEKKIAETKAENERLKTEMKDETAPLESELDGTEPENEETPVADTRLCNACGAPLEAGMIFCGKCGQKNDQG